MMWSRQAAASTRFRPLMPALLLLAGCASGPEAIDPRTAADTAAPQPEEWRIAASGIATEVAAAVKRRGGGWLVSLPPLEGAGAPADLHDMLLEELVLAGVPVAAATVADEGAIAVLRCRVSSIGTTERPRGVIAAVADPTAQTTLLCLLANDDRFVWASRRVLRPHQPAPGLPGGIIIEITG